MVSFPFILSIFQFSSGIFLSSELWNSENKLREKNFEFKAWTLPSSDDIRARKIAQLLNEFPISPSQANASVEIRTDSLNRTLEFLTILKSENVCLNSTKSTANVTDKFIIYHGDAKYLSTIKRDENETTFIVPSSETVKNIVMSRENFKN